MNEQKLKNFIALVTFDQSLIDIAHQVQISQNTNQKLQEQLLLLEKDLKFRALKQQEIEQQLHDQELKVKELQDQESHLIATSQSVSTPKEYEAANKEIDRIKFSRDQQEQRMMQMTNKVDLIKKEFQQFNANFQLEKDKLLVLIEKENEVIQGLKNQKNVLEQDRKLQMSDIPDEWLNTYETMRGRVSNPVVPVNQNSCSACFYFMAARDEQALRDKGLLQCKDCFRFLYHEQAA
jgi:predicted  nucleic acid-binding Zn-ribbon protein